MWNDYPEITFLSKVCTEWTNLCFSFTETNVRVALMRRNEIGLSSYSPELSYTSRIYWEYEHSKSSSISFDARDIGESVIKGGSLTGEINCQYTIAEILGKIMFLEHVWQESLWCSKIQPNIGFRNFVNLITKIPFKCNNCAE